jgi:hypothetical protein
MKLPTPSVRTQTSFPFWPALVNQNVNELIFEQPHPTAPAAFRYLAPVCCACASLSHFGLESLELFRATDGEIVFMGFEAFHYLAATRHHPLAQPLNIGFAILEARRSGDRA